MKNNSKHITSKSYASKAMRKSAIIIKTTIITKITP